LRSSCLASAAQDYGEAQRNGQREAQGRRQGEAQVAAEDARIESEGPSTPGCHNEGELNQRNGCHSCPNNQNNNDDEGNNEKSDNEETAAAEIPPGHYAHDHYGKDFNSPQAIASFGQCPQETEVDRLRDQ